MGLGVHPEFSVAKYGDVYKEVLGDEFPEETRMRERGAFVGGRWNLGEGG